MGGGELCETPVRAAGFPRSLQGTPLLTFCCEPAALLTDVSVWHLLLPTAMRLSGQRSFHEYRGTLYFTLSGNNRPFPPSCRPPMLIRGCQAPGRPADYSRGGSPCEVDELVGRWFQNGCKLSRPGSARRWFGGMSRNTRANGWFGLLPWSRAGTRTKRKVQIQMWLQRLKRSHRS